MGTQPRSSAWQMVVGLGLLVLLAGAAALLTTPPPRPTIERTLTPQASLTPSPTLFTKGDSHVTHEALSTPDGFVATMSALKATEQNLDTTRLWVGSAASQSVPAELDAQWLAAVRASSAADPVYGVIQFPLPFDPATRSELEASGVKFYSYVEVGGRFCRFPPGALPLLQELHAAGRVRYAGLVPPQARLSLPLWEMSQLTPTQMVTLTVITFEQPMPEQEAEIGRWLKITETFYLPPKIYEVYGVAQAKDLPALAQLPYVWYVAAQQLATPDNLESTMALGSDVVQWNMPWATGAGVQIAVIDTGIGSHWGFVSRVVDQHEYYPANDNFANDTDGHGTHVAGTAAGSGQGDPNGASWTWRGHAPGPICSSINCAAIIRAAIIREVAWSAA